jgi:hypothetical protein
MIEYNRCNKCENDYDQCSDCEKKDRDITEYEREHARCPWNNKFLAKQCRLGYVHVKLDKCSTCGYENVYP